MENWWQLNYLGQKSYSIESLWHIFEVVFPSVFITLLIVANIGINCLGSQYQCPILIQSHWKRCQLMKMSGWLIVFVVFVVLVVFIVFLVIILFIISHLGIPSANISRQRSNMHRETWNMCVNVIQKTQIEKHLHTCCNFCHRCIGVVNYYCFFNFRRGKNIWLNIWYFLVSYSRINNI